MVKIRVEGLPEDVGNIIVKLDEVLPIKKMSKPYQNRNSDLVRVYLDVEQVQED